MLKKRLVFSLLCVISVLCVISFATLVAAQSTVPARSPVVAQVLSAVEQLEQDPDDSDAYWTPERMRNAKPLPLPKSLPSRNSNQAIPSIPPKTTKSVSVNAQPPTLDINPDWTNQLFIPDTTENSSNSVEIKPLNVGTRGAYFTSSRLVPSTANVAYPYVTVGKLFFAKPGIGDFICSGSVIGRNVVLTAGHCVHNGNGDSSGFYTNFRFIPAYDEGSAPYGTWATTRVWTTNEWFYGNDSVPNPSDYAMFEMASRNIGGTLRRIGDIVGNLGFSTERLIPNHATLLGYPGNLDFGEEMHQVTSGSYEIMEPNTVIYGSDMGPGSSGGPWIQNFGIASQGQNSGFESGLNQVIGVASYGPVDTTILYQGSSIPDSRFLDIYNEVCNNQNGNC